MKVDSVLLKKCKYLILLLINFFVISFASAEEISMRRCTLLPILDDLQGALSYKVYLEIENYLKDSPWCYYQSNSKIIDILGNYTEKLPEHLQNATVLKLIATKLNAGSLIKINLKTILDGVEIQLAVHGQNGKDLYFKEKMTLKKNDVPIVAQTIVNWLEIYEKTIPYDGKVIGVLGDQFTIDIGELSDVYPGKKLIVKRPISKEKHPLLKEIVNWKSETLAIAEVISVSKFQAVCVVRERQSKKKLKKYDWVRFKAIHPVKEQKLKMNYSAQKGYEFGKLGFVKLGTLLGTSSAANTFNGSNREIGGLSLGVFADLVLLFTRNIWGSIEFGRELGFYKQKQGSLAKSSQTVSNGVLKVLGGYKFLPLGFYYGPQVDTFLGLGRYSVNLDQSTSDGHGEYSVSGILLGVRGNMPLMQDIRIFTRFDMIPFGGFSEDPVLYGNEDSAKSFQLKFGTQYAYDPQTMLEAALELTYNKVKFTNNNELKYKSTFLKFGALFNF